MQLRTQEQREEFMARFFPGAQWDPYNTVYRTNDGLPISWWEVAEAAANQYRSGPTHGCVIHNRPGSKFQQATMPNDWEAQIHEAINAIRVQALDVRAIVIPFSWHAHFCIEMQERHMPKDEYYGAPVYLDLFLGGPAAFTTLHIPGG